MKRSAALIFALLAACAPSPKHQSASPTPTPGVSGAPPLLVTGAGTRNHPVRIVQQRGNRTLYELTARSYTSRSANGMATATFHRVHITFYGHHGHRLLAAAPQAYVDEARKLVTMTGGVTARSNDGLVLRCRRLTYDQAGGMLHGRGDVYIVDRHGMRASGSRFDSNVSFTRMQMQ
ncbi:MAG: hypothetical protein ACYDHD_02920 [Vulcanimicrobiaceae bacterium]